MKNDFAVRLFDADGNDDYQAFAELLNYAYSHERVTPFALRIADSLRAEHLFCKRFVAAQNERVAGVASIEHWTEFYHPHKYLLHVIVRPEFQNQNAGSTLYNCVAEELRRLQPVAVHAWTRANAANAAHFAAKFGFERVTTRWNIALDVQQFDAAAFALDLENVRREGVAVKQLAELPKDFAASKEFYDFYAQTVNSIQSVEAAALPSFEDFAADRAAHNDELTFVAFHNNRIVGMWQIDNAGGSRLSGDAMSVAPEFRRRGAALALTVAAIRFAKEQGCTRLTAHTDEHNKAILTLAEKLGFKHLPAQDLYCKTEFAPETE